MAQNPSNKLPNGEHICYILTVHFSGGLSKKTRVCGNEDSDMEYVTMLTIQECVKKNWVMCKKNPAYGRH